MGIIWIVLGILLIGCARNLNEYHGRAFKGVDNVLNSENLNAYLKTQKIDLSVNGKCPGTLPLNVINAETRNERHEVLSEFGYRHYIIPNEFTDSIVRYIEEMLLESKLAIDEELGRKIYVSINEVKLEFGKTYYYGIGLYHTFEAHANLKIDIQEINYSQIYSGKEGGATPGNAAAYAIHYAVIDFLHDPVFQKHIKCH